MTLKNFPPPICDLCGRVVERVHLFQDPMTRQWVMTAECHGQFERAVIEVKLLQSLPSIDFVQGRAFLKHKAELPPKP